MRQLKTDATLTRTRLKLLIGDGVLDSAFSITKCRANGVTTLLMNSANESMYLMPSSFDGSTDLVTMREEISAHQQQNIQSYVYVFLGVVVLLTGRFMLFYCISQRRLQQLEQYDNIHNNMQRHLLEDSALHDGQVEWQCSVCYHENHPAKRECLMCGTSEVISQGGMMLTTPSTTKLLQLSTSESAESQATLVARNRSFHVRRLNEMNLNQRQRGARRRHLWQREMDADGLYRWVRVDHCQPSRITKLVSNIRASLPLAAASLLPHGTGMENKGLSAPDDTYSLDSDGSISSFLVTRMSHSNNEDEGMESELSMIKSAGVDKTYSPPIRKNVRGCHSPANCDGLSASAVSTDDGLIAQLSIGYIRHVNEQGQAEWVPADSLVHERAVVTKIDIKKYPRASNYIDFESVAALPFKTKVRWFHKELDKMTVPRIDGHLLLKVRREAIMSDSMHLLMLVPAADLRQRLQIEFTDEPGLDAGGLLREWVLLLCEQLFDDSYGLFQRTHADLSGYWINPKSREIHRDHFHCFQFVGRLLAKCLLEGQLMTLEALLQGLYDVLPRTLLVVFDYQELELLLCGVPSIDVADWESHTDIHYLRAGQGFNKPTSPECHDVQWFWDAVRAFSQEKRARLLQFVTGTSRVPAEGFRALLSNGGRIRRFGLQMVSINASPIGLYPKAHTCFNRLDLPVYRSYEELVTYLTLVINMEITGFTMQ
ncbi:unnamed protein product [Peronospora farinosa]|uniref:HECT-type E3 ubiquitin transferase n=1 Tax=Peronospora farinosa TaxID=134698 RepID=A0ABN8BU24_9STRA|nr:unnamed protein product [Peronospora farinosa]